MFEVKSVPYITVEDIEDVCGKHFSKYEFTQMVENGSFAILECDDGALEDLYEEQEWLHDKESGTYERITNQIELVEMLRAQGYRDTVLVFVSW